MWRDSKRCHNRGLSVADRTLGNSVGAIESVTCGIGASRTLYACGWGRFGVSPSIWYTPLPSGGQPTRFGVRV